MRSRGWESWVIWMSPNQLQVLLYSKENLQRRSCGDGRGQRRARKTAQSTLPLNIQEEKAMEERSPREGEKVRKSA